LIKAIVEVMQPHPGETIGDPACGTGGFLLGAHDYVTKNHKLDAKQRAFLSNKTLHGTELVSNTARLCAMNLFLHGIGGSDGAPALEVRDSLVSPPPNPVELVLANPPFGRKGSLTRGGDSSGDDGGEVIARPDFWVTTSHKQFNFVQHIVSMLKVRGRAAVILPDNVLFEGGAGEQVRRRLLDHCNVHTLLRLPTGLFYAQGVKANVLFFERRRPSSRPATSSMWVYDLRTNQRFTLKNRPLRRTDLDGFVEAYAAGRPLEEREESAHFKRWTHDELARRPAFNLDVWADVVDDADIDPSRLARPDVIARQMIDQATVGLSALTTIAAELAE
jgi:type I restriction enzyme M protein